MPFYLLPYLTALIYLSTCSPPTHSSAHWDLVSFTTTPLKLLLPDKQHSPFLKSEGNVQSLSPLTSNLHWTHWTTISSKLSLLPSSAPHFSFFPYSGCSFLFPLFLFPRPSLTSEICLWSTSHSTSSVINPHGLSYHLSVDNFQICIYGFLILAECQIWISPCILNISTGSQTSQVQHVQHRIHSSPNLFLSYPPWLSKSVLYFPVNQA